MSMTGYISRSGTDNVRAPGHECVSILLMSNQVISIVVTDMPSP